MPKNHRYFKREFLAKPDDDSNGTAVIARVSNHSESDMDWLSAALTLGSIGEFDSHFFISFYGSDPSELKEAVRQIEMLKKVITEFSDAVAAEVEALNTKKSDK